MKLKPQTLEEILSLTTWRRKNLLRRHKILILIWTMYIQDI